MTISEVKTWAKEKIKGKWLGLLPALIVAGILTGLTIGGSCTYTSENGFHYEAGYNLGWIFYFVQIGITYYMVKFIKDQPTEFKDIFRFSGDFVKAIGAALYQALMIFLFALLLVIPGIMKALAYALVPYLMADDKYKNMKVKEIMDKSEEMMNGHKMDYFLLMLSYIGWHILAMFTLGILEIWIVPYERTAITKFLTDIKENAEGAAPAPAVEQPQVEVSEQPQVETPEEPKVEE